MNLHTVNKSSNQTVLKECLAVTSKGDAVLLMEDGVYTVMDNPANHEILGGMAGQVELFALLEDLQARGISAKVLAGVKVINYRDFVNLCAQYPKIINWS